MSADWNDFDLPFGLVVPPSPEVLWPHEVWDSWVLERHAELVQAGLLRHEHNPLPRNFEALDLTGFVLPASDGRFPSLKELKDHKEDRETGL